MENKPFLPGDKNNRPTGPDGKPMKKFEIRRHDNKNMIFIDNEHFDWEVDKQSLEYMRKLGPQYLLVAERDIQKHFLESMSEFVGREITIRDIAFATQKGWI